MVQSAFISGDGRKPTRQSGSISGRSMFTQPYLSSEEAANRAALMEKLPDVTTGISVKMEQTSFSKQTCFC